MTTENRPTATRMPAATIIGTLGSGLLVATVVRLLQVGQEILPWWWPYPVIIGGILVIVALLLLVPLEWWSNIRKWGLGSSKWFCNTYYWKRYGPRCSISDPIFKNTELSEISEGSYRAEITASVMIWIRNKRKPLKVALSSTHVCLEQRVGWEQQKARFRLDTHHAVPEIMLKPYQEWSDQIVVSLACRGNRECFPDIKKGFRCGVWGIRITLPKRGMRELHKGSKCGRPASIII